MGNASETNPDVSVDHLLAHLGTRTRIATLPDLAPGKCDERNILASAPPTTFYLPPHLIDLRTGPDQKTFCILLDAPAGVGKTALAQYLARSLHAADRHVLYYPLKGAQIGEGFFSGLLADLFPAASPQESLNALFTGNVLFLLDGYDEVSLSTSQIELNTLFVKQIITSYGDWSKTSPVCPCIVFLFRSVFFDLGIFDAILPFARHCRINYFSRSQRRVFITQYLRFKKASTTTIDVDKLLTGFEDRLHAAVGDQEDAFFGHALVLGAFADSVLAELEATAELNPYRYSQDFASRGFDPGEPIAILKGIDATILGRECPKFPDAKFQNALPGFVGYPVNVQQTLLQALAAQISTPASNYAPLVEPTLRSVAQQMLEQHSSYVTLPEDDRKIVQEQYVDELSTRFDLHPYVGVDRNSRRIFTNPVYHEMYLARHIAASPGIEPTGIFVGYTTPSFFLAHFFLDILNGELSSHPAMLFYVINLLSASEGDTPYRVAINWDLTRREWFGEVVGSRRVAHPQFRISDEILSIQLPPGARLYNLDVTGEDCIVGLASPPGDWTSRVTLASVSVSTQLLEIDVPYIAFDGVTIVAQRLELTNRVLGLDGLKTLTLWPLADLEIVAPDAFKARLQDTVESQEGTLSLAGFERKLSTILGWFHRSGYSTYAVYEIRFNTVILKKNRDKLAAQLVSFLTSKRALRRQDRMVYLDDKFYHTYSIYYVKQNEVRFAEPEKTGQLYREWIEYVRSE